MPKVGKKTNKGERKSQVRETTKRSAGPCIKTPANKKYLNEKNIAHFCGIYKGR